MTILGGFRVVQIGGGLAASVCGRLLADAGATVSRIDTDRSTPLGEYLNRGCETADPDEALRCAGLIVCEGSPATLRRAGHDAATLRALNKRAAVVLISPFGQSGPRAEEPATDLTLFFASGIARMLTGQVDDLDEPPMRPAGEQSAFIGGLAAACAGMHAALLADGGVVDVSIHEALATLAITELTKASRTGLSWSRKRVADGNGATVCILPASDGYAAISPREDRQWAAWLHAMGSPEWGREARFASKSDRVTNWDALHALMADWSREKTRQWIAETAQAAHVPSFPLCDPAAGRIGVDEVGEVEAAGGDLQRRPDEAAQLPGRLVRIVAHGADELADPVGVGRHLPGDIGLHQNAQPVACADILQPGGRGAQAQIDRDRALHRCGQLPGQARFAQHPDRSAELGDHHRLARTDHDRRGGEAGAGQQYERQHKPHGESHSSRWFPVVSMIVIVVIVRMMCTGLLLIVAG